MKRTLMMGTLHQGPHGFQYWVRRMDWPLLVSVAVLVGIGFLAVLSAVNPLGHPLRFLLKQSLALGIGLFIFYGLSQFNYQFLHAYAKPIYGFATFLLLMVLLIGKRVNGSKGWFALGPFSFEPVELSRVAFIVALAHLLDRSSKDDRSFVVLSKALGLAALHMVLILRQPDLGGTLVYIPITLGMLYFAGMRPLYLLTLIFFGGIAVGLPILSTYYGLQPEWFRSHPVLEFLSNAAITRRGAWELVGLSYVALLGGTWLLQKFQVRILWRYPLFLGTMVMLGIFSAQLADHSLKDHQRKRIIAFLSPAFDPLDAGYNILQSEIAIGSGRVFGKGLFSGTQTQLGFLPERHTDFIFSVIGEELGLLWASVVLAAFGVLIWRSFSIATEAPDMFGSLIAVGVACKFAFECVMNMGMVLGLLPIVGVALPLVSYGGSHMVGAFFAIGLLLSVNFRRYIY